jgi:hypothetical protein
MSTIPISYSWLNEEFVPVVDPEDLKAAWNLGQDLERRIALRGTNDINVLYRLKISTVQGLLGFFQKALKPGADMMAVDFRIRLLRYAFTELGLPELDNGQPSEAILKAVAEVPVKVTPNLEYVGLPCDENELLQLIEKEKGSCGPLG